MHREGWLAAAVLSLGAAFVASSFVPLHAEDKPDPRAGQELIETFFLLRVTHTPKGRVPERVWAGRTPDEPGRMGAEPLIDYAIPFYPRRELHIALVMGSPEIAEFYFASNTPDIRLDFAGAELIDSDGKPCERIQAPILSKTLPGGVRQRYVEGDAFPGGTMVLNDRFVQGEPVLFRRHTTADVNPAVLYADIRSGKLKLEAVDDSFLASNDKKLELHVPARLPDSNEPEVLDFHLLRCIRWAKRPAK